MNFNNIPIDIRTPGQYIEFDNSKANQGLPSMPHIILVTGQRLTAGTVAAGVPVRITDPAQGIEYFGRGSMLAAMIAALKNANNYTECWAIALNEDAAGVAASGSIVFSGTSIEAGTLCIYIGGKKVKVAVSDDDTPTAIATAAAAAINANLDLPVTALAATGTVTLTCRWKGATGNDIDIRLNFYSDEKTPVGLTATITAMASGATNPDFFEVITAMADEQYHTVIMPFTDSENLTTLESELTDRWGPLIMKEGHAFAAVAGTHTTIATLAESRNCPHLTIMGSGKSPTPPWVVAAVLGGVDAFEPDPARPRQTLKLLGVLAPAIPDRFTMSERNIHLHGGASTCVTDAGGNVLIERLITTYTTNAFDIEDPSYLDVTTMRTLAYLRYSVRARIAQKFPRHKLADDGTKFGAGQAVVTPQTIRAELIALFIQWEESGLVEGREQFKSELIVERDGSDPDRLNALLPPDIINQFRIFAGSIQFKV